MAAPPASSPASHPYTDQLHVGPAVDRWDRDRTDSARGPDGDSQWSITHVDSHGLRWIERHWPTPVARDTATDARWRQGQATSGGSPPQSGCSGSTAHWQGVAARPFSAHLCCSDTPGEPVGTPRSRCRQRLGPARPSLTPSTLPKVKCAPRGSHCKNRCCNLGHGSHPDPWRRGDGDDRLVRIDPDTVECIRSL